MSKLVLLLAGAVVGFALFSATPVFAHDGEHHSDAATGAVSDAADDAAIAAYPLTDCVVSGESLDDDDMGGPVNYIYKSEGQPDRLVRLCCKRCVKKFNADPQKYLSMIDEAAAEKAK